MLPKFSKDTTDRNRTSPFAFTGNKFEFRMLGSSASVSDCNTIINTAVAESLCQFADTLEQAENFETALHELIVKTIRDHKRIIFNGNGYDDAWIAEAEKRGLTNLRTAPDAIPQFVAEKNIALFCKHKVFSERELRARTEIMLEAYVKVINIEALTAIDMVSRDILPAISAYCEKLGNTLISKRALADIPCRYESETLRKLSALTDEIYAELGRLEAATACVKKMGETLAMAKGFETEVLPKMARLRAHVDAAEALTATEYWPYPTYGDLLFGVR